MSSTDVLSAVRSALETIADSLAGVEFIVPESSRVAAEANRVAVIETIRKYLLHRLREPDAPVVAAIVGLSGVGKSTILNSLAQEAVSVTGVVRPTTKSGVLWAHRAHAARYWTEFVTRVREQVGPTTDVVIGDDPLTQFLTFIDTPPLEMTPAIGATGASDTLMFADICVFVTSSERYADAAQLGFLDTARARGIPILFVLNRLPQEAGERRSLLEDFAEKLVAAGLLPAADPEFLFGIDEAAHLRWHGGLEPEAVAVLRKELSEVSDPEFRVIVVDETAESTVQAVAEHTRRLVGLLIAERAARLLFRGDANEIYEKAAEGVRSDLESGRFASLSRHDVWSQAAVDLAGLVTWTAGLAAANVAATWSGRPGGGRLLGSGHEGLRRHGPDAVAETRTILDEWHRGLGVIAARHPRFRPRRRTARKLVGELWRSVLDPDRESRRWSGDRAEAVSASRTELAEAIADALRADAGRFGRRVGLDVPEDVPGRLAAAVAYLSDLTVGEPQMQTEGATHAG